MSQENVEIVREANLTRAAVGQLADYGGVNRAKKTSSAPCLARGRAWMNVAAKLCGRPARP